MLPDTYQECLALVARSGGVDRAEIAQELHLPSHLLESPDLRRLLRNAYHKEEDPVSTVFSLFFI